MSGRSGLADNVTSRWHLLAAVLAVMTMPHAVHRLAALHCLLRGRHRSAVERISGECDCEQRREEVSRKTHRHQPRSARGLRQVTRCRAVM